MQAADGGSPVGVPRRQETLKEEVFICQAEVLDEEFESRAVSTGVLAIEKQAKSVLVENFVDLEQ